VEVPESEKHQGFKQVKRVENTSNLGKITISSLKDLPNIFER
jgi:hypothetical protein